LVPNFGLNFMLLTINLWASANFVSGKKIEDMKNFINEGVYKVERLKEEGLITNMHYDDEV